MEIKEVMFKLYSGGRFIVNYKDENEYKVYIKEKNIHRNFLVTIFITFLIFILLFFIVLKFNKLAIPFIIVLLIFAAESKLYFEVERRFDRFKYNEIIREIKNNRKYKLIDNNDGTGRINYLYNGIKHKIYVFKGKNAKGV